MTIDPVRLRTLASLLNQSADTMRTLASTLDAFAHLLRAFAEEVEDAEPQPDSDEPAPG